MEGVKINMVLFSFNNKQPKKKKQKERKKKTIFSTAPRNKVLQNSIAIVKVDSGVYFSVRDVNLNFKQDYFLAFQVFDSTYCLLE